MYYYYYIILIYNENNNNNKIRLGSLTHACAAYIAFIV